MLPTRLPYEESSVYSMCDVRGTRLDEVIEGAYRTRRESHSNHIRCERHFLHAPKP